MKIESIKLNNFKSLKDVEINGMTQISREILRYIRGAHGSRHVRLR